MDPDLVFIQALQHGKDEGLNELIARHKAAVFRFTLRYTQNEADATDLTEETFVKVFFNAHKFRAKAHVKTWIFTIAANLCRDHFRKKKRHPHISLDSTEEYGREQSMGERLPHQGKTSAQQAEFNEFTKAVENAINELPHKLKTPFILFALEEHSHKDCAIILNCSPKAVETRIFRARKLLREKLSLHL
ncbi:MAG: sigma-70 family RNA polymerase sigma factor [Opitutaceae bacterium]|nr:sigma-70 family RNA polymerase sigma factor [Opitutaceae bacterium]